LVQESLGHKLRILRAERQMSLRRAAAEAGLAKETISEIERGLTHPHDVTLAKLARAYNVPVEDISK
jgi:transcriptional regulator with XRE-family HTH domain